MSHFAHITNSTVDSVININEDTITNKGGWFCPSCGEFKPLSEWVQTSYNTQRGEYTKGSDLQEKLSLKAIGSKSDTNARNRKNFAGVGYTYDKKRDAFIPPQLFPSWILNETTCQYEPPFPMPADGNYYEWNEKIIDWVIISR